MNQKHINFPVTLSGQWQMPDDENIEFLSDNLTSWLLDSGSLTARLKSHCQRFQVKVIGEEQQPCSAADACQFIKVGEPVLVREVLLYCDGVPQVFARSLLPLKSLTGQEEVLANLGEQPLGQVLFNNPSLERHRLEISKFDSKTSVAELAIELAIQSKSESLWGRRSLFLIENKPLVVAEVFMPNAYAYQVCE